MGTPPPVMMANLGMADTLILMVLALVVFGPRRLPQIGKQIGKLMYEFRKASNDFKFQMEEELRLSEEADRRKKEEEERQRALAASPPPAQIEQSIEPAIAPAESSAVETPIATPYPESPAAATGSPVAATESEPLAGSPIPAAIDAPAPPASIGGESPNANEAPQLRDTEAVEQSSTDGGANASGQFRAEAVAITGAESAPESPAETSTTVDPIPPAPQESATLRIQPPSTGEKVAAERPGARPEQQKLFAENDGKSPEPATPEAERSEPAAHHG